MRPQEYAKSIIGGVLAGLAVLSIGLGDEVISSREWVDIAVATLTVFAGVFGLPNAAKKDVVSQQTVTVETTQVTPKPVATTDLAEIPLATPESDPKDATVTGI